MVSGLPPAPTAVPLVPMPAGRGASRPATHPPFPRPRPAAPQRSDQRGFTLIETLLALALFSVVVAVISNTIVYQIRAAASNDSYTAAYTVAAEQLEQLRARRFTAIAAGTTQQTKGGTTFNVQTSVTNGSPSPNMKAITVDVSWTSPGGPKNVSLQTIYTEVRP